MAREILVRIIKKNLIKSEEWKVIKIIVDNKRRKRKKDDGSKFQ